MVEFSTPAWIALALVASVGILAILNSAATTVRNQTYVHDTKVKVSSLRKDYMDRVKGEEEEDDTILVVDEIPPLAGAASTPPKSHSKAPAKGHPSRSRRAA